MRQSVHPLPEEDLIRILDRVAPVLERLRDERVFITGATGFFGTWLLETFALANRRLRSNIHITALARDPNAFLGRCPHLDGEFDWLRGDVREFDFPTGTYSHVIHAATSVDARFNANHPEDALDTIIGGTRRVLAFAKDAGATNFLLTSSGAIYGPQPTGLARLPETYTSGPSCTDVGSVYAEGKRIAELQCAIAASAGTIQPKIARCFAFVGPRLPLDWHFAVGNFIGDALRERKIHIAGDGTPLRSYLYASDMVVWLLTILLDGQSMRPYNVGSEQSCSIAELAARVAQVAGLDVLEAVTIACPAGEAPPTRYVPDTERARTELGLTQEVPLDEALRKTMDWWRGYS
jgi:dTDP-glucose 4,6-dehydratase